jgi:hypothetical protein
LWKGADPTAFGDRAVSLIATEEASTPHARSQTTCGLKPGSKTVLAST